MKKSIFISTIMICILFTSSLLGNNIQVTQSTMSPPDTTANYRMVSFNLSWENSWRNDIEGDGYDEPYNHDAAWIFVKYKRNAQGWRHATLSSNSSQHSVPSGCELEAVPDGKGVFIKRSNNGTGSNNWVNFQLRWNFSEDSIDYNAEVDGIKVFAIEMVYVPEGSFWIGDPDGENADLQNNFYKILPDGKTGAYKITSEDSITIGTNVGDLYYKNVGLSGGDQAGPVPAAFPKGFNAFYCMKYEVTQGQYADFLNNIQSNLRPLLAYTKTNHPIGRNSLYYSDAEGMYVATRPDRAMPLLMSYYRNYPYSAAIGIRTYLHWSGLRLMTEFEYEKICRGFEQLPQSLEFAWGTSGFTKATNISGSENGTETVTNQNANVNLHQSNDFSGGDGSRGPLRVGIFAKSSSSRLQSGASYYGAMDMSGSLMEMTVSIGSENGRAYSGIHGDGEIKYENGFYSPQNWPNINYNCENYNNYQFRGGSWYNRSFTWNSFCSAGNQNINNGNGKIANRSTNLASYDYDTYYDNPTYGIRGVRTAP